MSKSTTLDAAWAEALAARIMAAADKDAREAIWLGALTEHGRAIAEAASRDLTGWELAWWALSSVVGFKGRVADMLRLARTIATEREQEERMRRTRTEGGGYESKLARDYHGGIRASRGNVAIILREAPEYAGRYRMNAMDQRVYAGGEAVTDIDEVRLAVELEHRYGIAVDPRAVGQVVEEVADAARYHPVVEYLQRLEWDKTPRLDRLLPDGFGSEDTELNRILGLRFAVGAVARAMEPGCKLDTMLVLQGPQGIRKSQGIRLLCGPDWFRDSDFDVQSKDAYAAIQGAWIYEIGEVEKWNRREQSVIKAFLSSQRDSYRPPYGRHLKEVPRTTVFAGSTNAETFLEDVTGSRRFWPVAVTSVDLGWLGEHRDQLWAEAAWLYGREEPWWLSDDEQAMLAAASERFQAGSDLEGPILSAVQDLLRERVGEDRWVTAADIAAKMDLRAMDVPKLAHHVARVLKARGWSQRRVVGSYQRVRAWFPPKA